MANEEEILKRWVEHFEELLKENEIEEQEFRSYRVMEEIKAHTKEEIEMEIKTLKFQEKTPS